MPSHADRVRRHHDDAGAPATSPSGEPHDVLKQPLSDLERYAGWLSKDHVSVAVRADVKALAAAMESGRETSLALLTLGTNIGRLPSGGIRTMLRKALAEVRAVLVPDDVEAPGGARS